MNVERMLAVADWLVRYVEASGLPERLEAITNSLQNQMGSPSEDNLNALSAARESLSSSVKKAEKSLEILPRTWLLTVEELGFDQYLPRQIVYHTEFALRGQTLELNKVRAAIEELRDDVVRKTNALRSLRESLNVFEIESSKPAPGEVEISVLVPRELFSNELHKFSEEIDALDRLVWMFCRLVKKDRGEVRLGQLSNPDPLIFLMMIPQIALPWLAMVMAILKIFEQVQKLKAARDTAERSGVSEKIVKQIEEQAQTVVRDEIEKFVPELVEKYAREKDAGALNEIVNGLRISMEKLAARIDRGYRIEAHVPDDLDESDDGEELVPIEDAVDVSELQDMADELNYFETGPEPILNLPKPEAGDLSTDTDDNTDA